MLVVGLDEVGRGCWAGPLVAAAVVLDPMNPIAGLNDSKKLSKAQRTRLAKVIHEQALAIGIGWVWPPDIDTFGITTAVKRAMEQAIEQVKAPYTDIIIDGNYNFLPSYSNVTTVIGADGSVPAASAASIVAKVARDTYMSDEATRLYPVYGFEKHVGYGTALHIRMLHAHGVTPIHRKSFKPIQQIMLDQKRAKGVTNVDA